MLAQRWRPLRNRRHRTEITWRRNGTFAGKRLATDRPDLVAEFTRPKPAFDVLALKKAHPDVYTAHRARVLRVPTV